MIDNLSINFIAFLGRMLTTLSVDEVLLLRCVKLSTNFRGLPLKMEMILSYLKRILFYLRSRID